MTGLQLRTAAAIATSACSQPLLKADTLNLHSGGVKNGRYMGGTATSLRF